MRRAILRCRVCHLVYETLLTHLMQEVDVYCEWVDKCEALNAEHRFGGDKAKEIMGGGLGYSGGAAAV